MQFNNSLGLSRFIGRRDGRRVPGRVPQEMLLSNLGPVIDLSVGGMRVLATKPHAGEIEVSLRSGDVVLALPSVVVWIRRHGFRRHEIGLAFVGVPEDVTKVQARISNDHRARSAV